MNNNWKTAKLSEVCTLNPRKPKWDKADLQRQVSFVPMAAVDAEAGAIVSPEVRPLSTVNKGYTYFGEKDVLIAKITPCMENGKAAIASDLLNGIGFGTTEFHVLRPSDKVVSEWVYHYIRQESFRKLAEHNMTGSVGQKRVPADFIAETEIPLPPLEEQRRIADKLDILLAKVNKCKSRLERIPEILKRFRQSVLADACSGKLTEDWREVNAAEKWRHLPFSETIQSIRGGTTIPPTDQETDLPVLRSSSVRPGTIDFTDVKYIPIGKSPSDADILAEGDIVFTRLSGSLEYVGNCVVVRHIPFNRLAYPDRLFCAKIKDGFAPDYIVTAFSSNAVRAELTKNAKSSAGHQRISISDLKETILPVPATDEQCEIVRRVNVLFSASQHVEKRFQNGIGAVERLSQSILSKAFRGELVETV